MPSITRPQKRGHARGSVTRTPRFAFDVAATGAAAGGVSLEVVIAATSRATPRIDRQSARFGVSLSVRMTSSRSSASRRSRPTAKSGSSVISPDASSESPSSLPEHNMPCDLTPRIAALRITTPPGSTAPILAHGTSIPIAAFGAPHTMPSGRSSPTSTLQRVKRSAFGCLSTARIRATTTLLNGGAALSRCSTSKPAMVKRSASSSLSIGGSTKVRNQCSENFIRGEGCYANWRRKRRSFSKNSRRSSTP